VRRSRLTIPTRIFLAFAGVLVAYGIASGASLLQHQRMSSTLRLLDETYVPLVLAISDAKASEAVVNTMLDSVLEERDAASLRRYLVPYRQIVPQRLAQADRAIDRGLQLSPDAIDRHALDEVRRTLREVRENHARSESLYPALFAALDRGERDQAFQIHQQIVRVESQSARQLLIGRGIVRSRIEATSRRAAEQQREAVVLVAFLSLFALAAGLGVSWWSQRLLAPLPRLQERVVAVAQGDLGARLPRIQTDDEIGRLAQEFERMVAAIAARDQTLRELQRMQERIVASLRSAVVVIDEDGLLREVNQAAASVLGIPREATGRPLSETGLLARLAGLEDAIGRVARGGDAVVLKAAPLVSHDGEGTRHVDVLVAPFGLDPPPPGGTFARRAVLLVADDVTEELATKARLIQTERLAAIGKMAAHVTHEVRNPLSSIALNVEVLAEELQGADPSVQAPLRAIQREIDRLTAITEEYLRLARVPAPRLEPEDAVTLITEVARFVEREMEASGCALELDIGPDLPLVAADEAQIRQALLNLLRNAREAMPSGGTIVLAAKAVGGGVEISVRDHGAGIAPEHRDKVFDLFFSTKERGTGLGLPLTQQIVIAHGGRIRCEDAPGGGTVFTVWLPAAGELDARAGSGARGLDTRAEAHRA
jgi:signal transduction histidine kinase/HAMP domain-containing protein